MEQPVPPAKKKRTKHYINNVDFYNALKEWKEKLKTNPNERMSDYIGLCFQQLATNRAKHPWYNGWTFKDDMISEAIYICVKYAYNFDPELYNNPFAYFTQCCNNAFEQIKMKEKKLADFRFEMVKEGTGNSDEYDYNNMIRSEDY